jgi:hypothetical protein
MSLFDDSRRSAVHTANARGTACQLGVAEAHLGRAELAQTSMDIFQELRRVLANSCALADVAAAVLDELDPPIDRVARPLAAPCFLLSPDEYAAAPVAGAVLPYLYAGPLDETGEGAVAVHERRVLRCYAPWSLQGARFVETSTAAQSSAAELQSGLPVEDRSRGAEATMQLLAIGAVETQEELDFACSARDGLADRATLRFPPPLPALEALAQAAPTCLTALRSLDEVQRPFAKAAHERLLASVYSQVLGWSGLAAVGLTEKLLCDATATASSVLELAEVYDASAAQGAVGRTLKETLRFCELVPTELV